MNEKVTFIKALGAALIMLGVSLIGIATPGDIPTDHSKAEVETYIGTTAGAAYLLFLISLVAICIVVISIFEYYYPLEEPQDEGKEKGFMEKMMQRHGLRYQGDEWGSLAFMSKAVEHDGLTNLSDKVCAVEGLAAISKKIVIKKSIVKNDQTPLWLNSVMGVVYPGSLGVDEGIGHLAMKAFMALLSTCGDYGECGSEILWGMIMMWLVTSLGTLWQLRTVFRRYDVTQALPIEYGAVMACDALSAIIFYKEDVYMTTLQLALTLGGVLIIIIGIMVGRIQAKPSYSEALVSSNSALEGGNYVIYANHRTCDL